MLRPRDSQTAAKCGIQRPVANQSQNPEYGASIFQKKPPLKINSVIFKLSERSAHIPYRVGLSPAWAWPRILLCCGRPSRTINDTVSADPTAAVITPGLILNHRIYVSVHVFFFSVCTDSTECSHTKVCFFARNWLSDCYGFYSRIFRTIHNRLRCTLNFTVYGVVNKLIGWIIN